MAIAAIMSRKWKHDFAVTVVNQWIAESCGIAGFSSNETVSLRRNDYSVDDLMASGTKAYLLRIVRPKPVEVQSIINEGQPIKLPIHVS